MTSPVSEEGRCINIQSLCVRVGMWDFILSEKHLRGEGIAPRSIQCVLYPNRISLAEGGLG